jgi:hypothetical protein
VDSLIAFESLERKESSKAIVQRYISGGVEEQRFKVVELRWRDVTHEDQKDSPDNAVEFNFLSPAMPRSKRQKLGQLRYKTQLR